MTLQELSDRENQLYSKVIELYSQPQSDEAREQLQAIFSEYKILHQEYAKLSAVDIESLKRGLFIQWYAMTEPSYLTGISDLDINAECEIIQNLQKLIAKGQIDDELTWMLNYYANWGWVFERLEPFKGFDSEIVNDQNNDLPDKIDRERMTQRGQMGKYWNSLTHFTKN